jgi:4-carboxymuconolactone decarboxylase
VEAARTVSSRPQHRHARRSDRTRPDDGVDLAPRDRSLVTISALIANGQVAQLTGHIPIGMNNGLTQPEIAEAITHLAFYVGWPNAFSAMPVAKDVFEKRPR